MGIDSIESANSFQFRTMPLSLFRCQLKAKSTLKLSAVVFAMYFTLFGVMATRIWSVEKISRYWLSSIYCFI